MSGVESSASQRPAVTQTLVAVCQGPRGGLMEGDEQRYSDSTHLNVTVTLRDVTSTSVTHDMAPLEDQQLKGNNTFS